MHKEMRYAPVVAFAYNRADKIINCLKSLECNPEAKETDLIIYSDGPKSNAGMEAVANTRKAIREYQKASSFSKIEVVEAPSNKGLAASIIDGVTEVLKEYGRAIIVEDDLVVAPNFLSYMNRALDYYRDNIRIGAISAYTYPLKSLKTYDKDVYIMHKGDCWGWATWDDRWNSAKWADVDFDVYFKDKKLRRAFENTENGWDINMLLLKQGKINSWAIRWVLYLFKQNLWTIYPRESLVSNQGFDGSGTHSNKSDEALFSRNFKIGTSEISFANYGPNIELEKEAARYPFRGIYAGLLYRLKRMYVWLYEVIM